jgi:hypothetical protein
MRPKFASGQGDDALAAKRVGKAVRVACGQHRVRVVQ